MSKFLPFALLSFALVSGCALKYSPPDVDPKARVQFQEKFQAFGLTIQGQVSLSFQTTNHGHISLNLLRKRK